MSSDPDQTPDKALAQALESAIDYAWQQAAVEGAGGAGRPLRLVVALSGGADSTAVLHAVSRYLGNRFTVLALHADHGLNAESGRWAEHCRQLCRRLRVPLEVESVAVSEVGNLEAAAREARYGFFARHLSSDDLMLFGHHQQDQAETLLLRILQGRGAVGMRYYGRLGQGHFIRPFLSLPKEQLVDYLTAAGEDWIDDPSNSEIHFDRNYLRHELLPILSQRWPGAVQALARVSADAGAQAALVQRYVAALPNQVSFDLVPHSRIEARVWLRAFLASRGHHRITDGAIDEYFRQQKDSGRASMALESQDLGGAASLHAWRNELYYERAEDGSRMSWPDAGTPLPWRVRWRQQILEIEADHNLSRGAVGYTGQLRMLDREQLIEMDDAMAQRLKKHFQRGQIPPWRRSGYPLVCDEQGLVCVPGIWQRETSAQADKLSGYCTIRWLNSKKVEA